MLIASNSKFDRRAPARSPGQVRGGSRARQSFRLALRTFRAFVRNAELMKDCPADQVGGLEASRRDRCDLCASLASFAFRAAFPPRRPRDLALFQSQQRVVGPFTSLL